MAYTPEDIRQKSIESRYEEKRICKASYDGTFLDDIEKTPSGITMASAPIDDPVNHPKHYTSHPSGIECIQITEHMNFCLGNVLKYIWRTDHKDGLKDLKKARWYLDREIERVEKTSI